MKFIVEKTQFFEGLSSATRALSQRTGAAGVKLTLDDKYLLISGRESDLTIEVTLSVSGSEAGTCIVPASLTSDLVRSLVDGAVEFVADDTNAVIRGGRSEFVVQLLPDLDPPFITGPEVEAVQVDDSEFREAVRQVIRASSKDDTRDYMYTGVLFSSVENGLRLVATDGIRLGLRDIAGLNMLREEIGNEVILPSRALGELDRIIQGSPKSIDSIFVRIGKKEAVFEFGDTKLTTRLIDEKFRDYRQLLQPSYPRVMLADRKLLIDALRRLRRMAKEAREITHVRLEMINGTSLELSVRIPQVGQATENLDITYSGDDFVVAFDPDLLLDGVEATTTEIVRIEFTENNRPACITNSDEREFQYLLMPIRLK